jgi:hypothetical protein
MAEAPSRGAAEPGRTRDWASLLPQLPYFAIVILGLIGVNRRVLFALRPPNIGSF